MPHTLLKNFGSHITWSPTNLREQMEFLFFHDAAQSKVGNHDVRILSNCSEEQIFGLEITMDDTTVVDILHGLHDSAHQARRITKSVLVKVQDIRPLGLRLMVVTLGAYPVKEFTSTAQVETKVQ